MLDIDDKCIQGYLKAALLGMPLVKSEVQKDLLRVFTQLIGEQEWKEDGLYIKQGRTYLDQVLMARPQAGTWGEEVLTIRIKKDTATYPGRLYEHDTYGGFRVAMSGLLGESILKAMLRS